MKPIKLALLAIALTGCGEDAPLRFVEAQPWTCSLVKDSRTARAYCPDWTIEVDLPCTLSEASTGYIVACTKEAEPTPVVIDIDVSVEVNTPIEVPPKEKRPRVREYRHCNKHKWCLK